GAQSEWSTTPIAKDRSNGGARRKANPVGSFSGLGLGMQLGRDSPAGGLPGRPLKSGGTQFRLRLANYAELEEALARLRQAGVAIREMEVQPPDLEEVFLRLTGRGS